MNDTDSTSPQSAGLLTRRALLAAAAGTVPAVMLGGAPADAALSWPRRPGQIIQSLATRTHGPVMFIGDSTSAKGCDRMGGELAKRGVGPYRVDLNLARYIAVNRSLRPSAVAAVRRARAAGFDPPTFVIGLGFSDLLNGIHVSQFLRDPIAATALIVEPLLQEIGPDRTVAFLNLFGTVGSKSSRATMFNSGLAALLPQWPRLHIIDWASVARRNRWWHKVDGFHYTYTGGLHRQRFVCNAMVTATQMRLDDDARLTPTDTTTPTSTSTLSSTTKRASAPTSGV